MSHSVPARWPLSAAASAAAAAAARGRGVGQIAGEEPHRRAVTAMPKTARTKIAIAVFAAIASAVAATFATIANKRCNVILREKGTR